MTRCTSIDMVGCETAVYERRGWYMINTASRRLTVHPMIAADRNHAWLGRVGRSRGGGGSLMFAARIHASDSMSDRGSGVHAKGSANDVDAMRRIRFLPNAADRNQTDVREFGRGRANGNGWMHAFQLRARRWLDSGHGVHARGGAIDVDAIGRIRPLPNAADRNQTG